MRRAGTLLALAVALLVAGGCGGGGEGTPVAPGLSPTSVGPFVIGTASSAAVNVQSIDNRRGAAFVALSTAGVIDSLATVEPMDRLLFARINEGSRQIYRASFFGDNIQRLTNRADGATNPEWSPDGRSIAYNTDVPSQDIIVMDAEGLNERRLTNSPNTRDVHPTWSPDSRWIAFISSMDGNVDIHKMYSDGSGEQRLTSDPGFESNPRWNPTSDQILFEAAFSIKRIDAEGNAETTVTSTAVDDSDPTWHPNGIGIAYTRDTGGDPSGEIFTDNHDGTNPVRFAGGNGLDNAPTYSTDGEWLFFTDSVDVGFDRIVAKQTRAPYRLLEITDDEDPDRSPDLGSPVPTVTRTLIGPSGADHGFDPVHEHAIACVAVFDDTGYLNFVRLGVSQERGSNLEVRPLTDTGDELVGVVWSVPEMFYVEQDAGIGEEPTIWDMPGTSRTIVLYLDAQSGKLVSILDLDDDTSTVDTAAATSTISHEVNGSATTARGSFRAVWDADGEFIAEGEIGTVEIDANTGVVRAY